MAQTTNGEHMAMVAAGMSDSELQEVVNDGPEYFSRAWFAAVEAERRTREEARFEEMEEGRQKTPYRLKGRR